MSEKYTRLNQQEISKHEHSEFYNAKNVIIQDQFSEAIDLYLCKLNGTTNPTIAITKGTQTINVVSNIGAVVGDCINIKDEYNYFQSIVTNITGTVITIASPVDKDFPITSSVCFGEWDLSQANGSVTPVSYFICPPSKVKYDIYTIIISIEDDSVMYESTFGGLPALTNGIILRVTDGYDKQLFLVTNNGGFTEYGFTTKYSDKVPSGTYAFWAVKNYKDVNGVSLRIDGNNEDRIEVIIPANLTGLSKMAITVHGHLVQD